jgi:hypothetical protein
LRLSIEKFEKACLDMLRFSRQVSKVGLDRSRNLNIDLDWSVETPRLKDNRGDLTYKLKRKKRSKKSFIIFMRHLTSL